MTTTVTELVTSDQAARLASALDLEPEAVTGYSWRYEGLALRVNFRSSAGPEYVELGSSADGHPWAVMARWTGYGSRCIDPGEGRPLRNAPAITGRDEAVAWFTSLIEGAPMVA